jgi:hypothetical protein
LDLHVNTETLQLLKKNTGENCSDPGLAKDF